MAAAMWETVMPPADVSNWSHTISNPACMYRVRSGN
jgi:hypothetical protein